MKAVIAASVAIALAACGQRTESTPVDRAQKPRTVTKPQRTAPPKAFNFDEKDDLIDFHFAWSAEAAAVPQLASRFQSQMTKAKDELIAGAKQEKAWRDQEGLEFHGLQSSTDYKTAGQSNRLLSLSVDAASYTGGAHGNYGTNALLWDRKSSTEIKLADLFAATGNRDRLLTQRWCDALNRAREEKRGEPVGEGGTFDDCPGLDDIAIVPTDKDANGRFERLILTASPYVAGPYSEGDYEIDLAITGDLIAGLKEEHRDSFEVGQPQ